MRNRYAGACKDCGETVGVGEGYFEKQRGGGWRTRHVLCVANKILEGGAQMGALTLAQRQAVHADRESRKWTSTTPPAAQSEGGDL